MAILGFAVLGYTVLGQADDVSLGGTAVADALVLSSCVRRLRLGDVVQLVTQVSDDAGNPAAPGGITLKIQHEDGSEDEIPAADVRDGGLGRYVVGYRPVQPGRHLAIWEASGDYAGVTTVIFDVDATDLAFMALGDVRKYLGTTSATDAEIVAAMQAERDAQSDWCRVDPYTWQLREALLRRIARNLAARRTPTSVVNALGQATSGASSAQLDAEISRLEAPHRKAGFA